MPPIDPKLLRRVPTLRRGLTATGIFAVASAAAIVAQAVALSFVLVSGVAGELDTTALAFTAAAFAARALLAWGQQVTSARAAAAVKEQLRSDVLGATGRRRPLWNNRAGEAVTLITRGVDGLDAYITGYLPQLCLAATVPVTILIVLAFNDWASLIVIAITLPLIPIFGVLIGWHTKSKTEKQWRTLSRLGGHFLDTVSGLSTLRIFGRAGSAAKSVADTADRYRRATMETLRVAFLSALVLELVATVSVALVAVPIGLRLLEGGMDLRTAFLVLLLAPEVYLPLRAVGTQFHAAAEGMEATKEALSLVDEAAAEDSPAAEGVATETSSDLKAATAKDSPVPEGVAAEGRSSQAAKYPQAAVCPQEMSVTLDSSSVGPTTVKSGEEDGGPLGLGWLELAGLTVCYPGRDVPALDGVSARAIAGETVALVGPSGAGKTTLLNVLLGFVVPSTGGVRWAGTKPLSANETAASSGETARWGTADTNAERGGGEIARGAVANRGGVGEDRVDGDAAGGVELATADIDAWRRRIAWVPQRPHLFAASLADNIRLGQPDASLAEVVAAAEAAHATEFIDELPDGYDTMLGQDGFGLSAGQARRVALARAFLRIRRLDCPLVLLDEPTASLDSISEALVAEATTALLRGRTALVVAHRPALVDGADRVWRIESGRLVSDGQRVREVTS
ncbi:ABC transporter transmembrane domain-containing protein [Stackebrandtia nassauensis]|uniref:ABC transporter, CydDC cysteine exporter (CydDC-E) family, permease/ATP-binding protein CydD n=1 Tax=Stackebrandtia nassauensis (strain DSM 44728 / CIP 108903 / NRRL B-16338 / NBRC 102104 / LLR-40K-21) TaxID=446470 RepID=D3QA24_STANL|nr:ABC transporter transmembrane domain-containing protein [Stackebrandtia nassauensis]ADD40736.1 ABC transporter, CydDC cysteine exporter (CydDC- E) family, permease/ATP-binding protein CydD [Stackebrandtia nassauensis DSM 44728]